MITCESGHTNPVGNRFCQECGLLLQIPASTGAQSESPFPAFPAGPGISQKKRPTGWIIGGSIAALVAVVASVLIFVNREPPTTTMMVDLTVFNDEGCTFGFGYADVPGSNVTVSMDGKLVAVGNLGRFGDESFGTCTFDAQIESVPTSGDFYEITIGGRGTQTSTRSELESADWSYSASLGR